MKEEVERILNPLGAASQCKPALDPSLFLPIGRNQNQMIIFFAVKDGEALYSQQEQDQELTVAQIINSLLPNSDLS